MKNVFYSFIGFGSLTMSNRWLYPPKILNLYPPYFNCKYVDAIKYEPNTNLLAIGTNDGYTALLKINNKKGLYRSMWVNRPFTVNDGVKSVDILPKHFVVNSVYEKTKIYTTKNKLIFDMQWNSTTSYETIIDDLYYRFDYFGNVIIHNISTKTFVDSLKLNLEGYTKIVTLCDDKFFIITDNNKIYMFDLKFIKLLEHHCGNSMILPRTAIIKRLSNQYFILIGFHSGDICSYNFLINKVEKDDDYEITYQLKSSLITKHTCSIIKFIISANLFLVFDNNYDLTCYKLNTLTPTTPLQKIYSIKLDAEYTTTLEYSNNYIFMNGFKGIKILDYSTEKSEAFEEEDLNYLPIN